MKLLILSDLHAEFETFEVRSGLDYDVAVLAGDIVAPGRVAARWLRDPARFPNRPIILIAGNHEYYETVMAEELAEMRRRAADNDIHFLDCDQAVIGGVRFVGCTLWTDFRLRMDVPGLPGQPMRLVSDRYRSMTACSRYLADYSAIRVDDPKTSNTRGTRLVQPLDMLRIHQRHRSWLRSALVKPFVGATVVVTHHAPHRGSLASRYARDWSSGGFVSELPSELFQIPSLWVHGHTHTSFDYRVGECRVISNPRGYPNRHGEFENTSFDPCLMVEI